MRIKINNQPKRRRNSFSINVKDSKIILKNSFEPCSEQEIIMVCQKYALGRDNSF